ncbi:MAG: hypothetical protein NXI20_18925 [bacterium]|nr:hypothetical protein [bacterium]
MKWILFVLAFALQGIVSAQVKTVHVFVALCDNKNQGILPVPESIGNGQDPRNNLYWGALYGVKTYFKKSSDWNLLGTLESPEPYILERLLFKHSTKDVYLLADAYDGANIKETVKDFMDASSGNFKTTITADSKTLEFGGKSNLMTYIGHNGLMDFYLDKQYKSHSNKKRETIILACISKSYFTDRIKDAGATPLLWTTGYMAPEAYTLEWALDAWVEGKSNLEVRQKAAEAYNHYQKCGVRGAKGLLVTGF